MTLLFDLDPGNPYQALDCRSTGTEGQELAVHNVITFCRRFEMEASHPSPSSLSPKKKKRPRAKTKLGTGVGCGPSSPLQSPRAPINASRMPSFGVSSSQTPLPPPPISPAVMLQGIMTCPIPIFFSHCIVLVRSKFPDIRSSIRLEVFYHVPCSMFHLSFNVDEPSGFTDVFADHIKCGITISPKKNQTTLDSNDIVSRRPSRPMFALSSLP